VVHIELVSLVHGLDGCGYGRNAVACRLQRCTYGPAGGDGISADILAHIYARDAEVGHLLHDGEDAYDNRIYWRPGYGIGFKAVEVDLCIT